jgi:hypothetical protein
LNRKRRWEFGRSTHSHNAHQVRAPTISCLEGDAGNAEFSHPGIYRRQNKVYDALACFGKNQGFAVLQIGYVNGFGCKVLTCCLC